MNGESAEPWVATMMTPRSKKTEIMGMSHHAFFSIRRLKICFTVLDFEVLGINPHVLGTA